MDSLQELGAVVAGFLIRFGVPIGLTALVAMLLRMLDNRWQAEAELVRVSGNSLGADWNEVRCWEISDCQPEARDKCPAYLQQEEPCWQVFRGEDQRLKEECLTCEVFVGAPVFAAA